MEKYTPEEAAAEASEMKEFVGEKGSSADYAVADEIVDEKRGAIRKQIAAIQSSIDYKKRLIISMENNPKRDQLGFIHDIYEERNRIARYQQEISELEQKLTQ